MEKSKRKKEAPADGFPQKALTNLRMRLFPVIFFSSPGRLRRNPNLWTKSRSSTARLNPMRNGTERYSFWTGR